jgi:phosphoheptose isomerase
LFARANRIVFLLNGGFSYAALYKFGELLGNYRVKKNPFGATFILQEVQLLACLHALGNDAVL